ncbi:MAG TPA: DNA polymerase III subunit gamma/tau [Spirochaetota bacterium]|nr:DNA polymerase III subunit gamma/tau [Spirochaetota bacterium]HOL55989.1 DNA polymerase III subunit gamma/tau [Spirochaetota bacterium]HPP03431.1 DNA polymerase III subunit gamma/tau [Spirochaetota bacterium]
MAYEVTASKFRPQSFDELAGQEFVSSTLRNSIQNKKIANAYLLSGPRGVGKTSTARIIAKALNCEKGPTPTPCNVCSQCVTITAGNNSDVIEIDGASNTSINDIRVIQEEILYPPISGKYKVYIIDEVHMLSKQAFNALLKTIEEPPPNVVFVFATTEINKVPSTIRSRCQQFNLRLIPVEIIYSSLKKVLDKYNVKYEDKAVKWIAREGKGSMRDAYTLLDQVIAFCDNDITMEKIQEKLGLVGDEKITEIVSFIVKNNSYSLLGLYNNIIENGVFPEQVIIELIKFFRLLLLKKLNISNSNLFYEETDIYNSFVEYFSVEDIENILEVLFSSYEKSRYSVDIRLEIELTLLKLLKFREFIRPSQIFREINNLKNTLFEKKKLNDKAPIFQVDEKKEDKISNKQSESIIIPVEKSDIIKELKNRISPANVDLLASLNNIDLIKEVESNKMNLFFSKEIYYDVFVKNREFLENECKKILGGKKYTLEAFYKPELKKERSPTIKEINISRIKEIFNGKEFM